MKVKEFAERIQEDMQGELTKHLQGLNIVITAENINEFTEEQFAEIRHTGFGASDSSKILNVNPFPGGTPEELLKDKINKVTNDEIGKKPTVRMGKDLEDFIIDRLGPIIDLEVLKPIHMYGRKENGLNTNFDGVLFESTQFVPAEIKTISMYGRRYYDFTKALIIYPTEDKDISDTFRTLPLLTLSEAENTIEDTIIKRSKEAGIPAYYYTQLQQQIDFLNSSYGYIVALDVSEWRIIVYKVRRDNEVIAELNKRAKNLYIRLQIANGTLIVDENDNSEI